MKILVDRYLSNDKATLSKVSVDGEFVCFGLEDEFREVKVRGETRIPAGTYKVLPRVTGGFHARYKTDARTAPYHRGMLHVQDVPGFEYILIHIGNFETQTDGCLLVGTVRNEENMSVLRSAIAYEKLYKKVIGAAFEGNLEITYVDNDRSQS